MKIEITYKFDMTKYCNETNSGFLLNVKAGTSINYSYISKLGEKCSVNIVVKMLEDEVLLGNNAYSEVQEESDLYANISFVDQEEYNNFVLPNWLENFKYIE